MAACSDELKAKLQAAPDWDLVVWGKPTKWPRHNFGGEASESKGKRKVGKLLRTRTRSFLRIEGGFGKAFTSGRMSIQSMAKAGLTTVNS